MDYKRHCESLYRAWLAAPSHFGEFEADFSIGSLPEPYFPIRPGSRTLLVLNNNPGKPMPHQDHSHVQGKFRAGEPYSEVASWLTRQYISTETKINARAKSRNTKVEELADALGYDGIENVETFYLHSSKMDKARFLRKYANHPMVVDYVSELAAYVKERPVLVVACVASNRSFDKDSVIKSPWLNFQAELVGLNIGRAQYIKLTEKPGKVTSGLIRDGDKIMICSMGANNIPIGAREALSRKDVEVSHAAEYRGLQASGLPHVRRQG